MTAATPISASELQAKQRHGGDERILGQASPQQGALGETARPGCADVVLLGDRDCRGPGQPVERADLRQGQGDDGQYEVLGVGGHVGGDRQRARTRKHVQFLAQHQDQDQPDPKFRQGEAGARDGAGQAVEPASGPHARVQAARQGDQGGEDQRRQDERRSDRQAFGDLRDNRDPAVPGAAKASVKELAEPVPVLLQEALVQSQLLPQRLDGSRCGARAEDHGGRVSRGDRGQREHHEADGQQQQRQKGDAPTDHGSHGETVAPRASTTSGSWTVTPVTFLAVANCRSWLSTTTLNALAWYSAETFW